MAHPLYWQLDRVCSVFVKSLDGGLAVNVTLYVGNIPWSTRAEDLLTLVSPHATVRSARIIMDRETGRPKGYGFVEVEASTAPAAITALHQSEMGGRVIVVNEAQPRQR